MVVGMVEQVERDISRPEISLRTEREEVESIGSIVGAHTTDSSLSFALLRHRSRAADFFLLRPLVLNPPLFYLQYSPTMERAPIHDLESPRRMLPLPSNENALCRRRRSTL
jgi:hypothetical protein